MNQPSGGIGGSGAGDCADFGVLGTILGDASIPQGVKLCRCGVVDDGIGGGGGGVGKAGALVGVMGGKGGGGGIINFGMCDPEIYKILLISEVILYNMCR